MTLGKLFNFVNFRLLNCEMGLVVVPTSWPVLCIHWTLVLASGKEACGWWGRKARGITWTALGTASAP